MSDARAPDQAGGLDGNTVDLPPVVDAASTPDLSSGPDHSSHDNHGLGYGINHAQGVHGLAASFAGAQSVTVADDASLDFTAQLIVEAWIYPTVWSTGSERVGLLDSVRVWSRALTAGEVCWAAQRSGQLCGADTAAAGVGAERTAL